MYLGWRQVAVTTGALDSAFHPFLQASCMEFVMTGGEYDFIVNNILFHL